MYHPELLRVLDPQFVANAAEQGLDELYRAREVIHQVEGQLSFVRRLAQGRIDILCTELERRDLGGEPGDLGELISRLPEVFGAGQVAPSTRTGVEVVMDPSYVEALDAVAGSNLLLALPEYTSSELDAIVQSLEAFEQETSVQRRGLHNAIDAVQIEIARRYRSSAVG
jgi:hypothetical protein